MMRRHILSLALAACLACFGPAAGAGAEQASPQAPAPGAGEVALRAAAQEGDPEAQYALGLALLRPIPPHFGPVKEGAEAVTWLEKSEAQGKIEAAFLLGYMYQFSVGVSKDVGKALHWLTKAADAGHVPAMVTLAAIYKVGDGAVKNKIKARDYYAKAAEKGNNNARTALAAMYMEGDGVPRDGALALAWFRRAARDGHAPAMLGLGTLYARSDLGKQNGPKAAYWTHQAVVHGHAPAVRALGLLYRDGAGTLQPDAYKAYLWLRLSHELAVTASGKPAGGEIPSWLASAQQALTPEQLRKADKELAAWLRQGPPAPPAVEPE